MSEIRWSSSNRLPRALVATAAATLILSACQTEPVGADRADVPVPAEAAAPTCQTTPDSGDRSSPIVEVIMPEETQILLEGTDQQAQAIWDEVLGTVRQRMDATGIEAAEFTVHAEVTSDDQAPFYTTEAADAAAALTQEAGWQLDMRQDEGSGLTAEYDYLAAIVVTAGSESAGVDCRML